MYIGIRTNMKKDSDKDSDMIIIEKGRRDCNSRDFYYDMEVVNQTPCGDGVVPHTLFSETLSDVSLATLVDFVEQTKKYVDSLENNYPTQSFSYETSKLNKGPSIVMDKTVWGWTCNTTGDKPKVSFSCFHMDKGTSFHEEFSLESIKRWADTLYSFLELRGMIPLEP